MEVLLSAALHTQLPDVSGRVLEEEEQGNMSGFEQAVIETSRVIRFSSLTSGINTRSFAEGRCAKKSFFGLRARLVMGFRLASRTRRARA